jgi:hypothetical protein
MNITSNRYKHWNTTRGGADSGCARKCSGESGPDAARRERAHQRVSTTVDSKAKLTVALDGVGRDSDHGTSGGRWWAVAELSVRAGRARERARELGIGHK